MNDYKVVSITNNLERYPDCKDDTEEYPHLIDFIQLDDITHNEWEVFIVENGDINIWWRASEFFYMVDMKEFKGYDL